MIKNLAIGGSNRTLLVLALLMGLLCAMLVGIYLSNLEEGGGGGTSETTPVVVAAVDIPALTTITPEMVQVEQVPLDLVLAGAFTDTEVVVGKKTQVAVVPGQQLLTTNAVDAELAQEAYGPDAPLSLIIPEGKRAYAIYVSKVASVGGLARAGDYVDLMLTEDVANGTACYVMQNIQVLATGATVARAGTDASAVSAVATNGDANTYTLAVTPGQAAQLATVQKSVSDNSVGTQMWVVLRQFGDHDSANVPACAIQ